VTDTKFNQNIPMYEANDFPWMAYHVLFPDQNVGAQYSHMMRIIEALNGPMPKWVWWDVQRQNGRTKRQVSEATIKAVEFTKPYFLSGVYSARWFTSGYMETQDWFGDIDWWIAQWLWPDQQAECPWPTILPATVSIDQVMIHQTTSYGDGKLLGVGSTRLDLDRWMWTEEKFNEIMGTEVPPNGDLEDQVSANRHAITELRGDIDHLSDLIGSVRHVKE